MISRRLRTALALLLCLLVVGMQQELQRHALSHFVGYAGAHERAIPTPLDTTCAECALLAAGSAALAANAATPPCSAGAVPPAQGCAAMRAAERPSFYRSRAPPALS
jgi:hypothetical protein